MQRPPTPAPADDPPADLPPGYPAALEERRRLPDGTELLLRPIRPGDWRLLQDGFRRLSPRDRHYRFLGSIADMDEALARRLATVDYERQIAFLALRAERSEAADPPADAGLGIVRLVRNGEEAAEIALVILDRWKRRGLGQLLGEKAFAWARSQGIARVEAIMLQENVGMRQLAQSLGFRLYPMAEDSSMLRAELLL